MKFVSKFLLLAAAVLAFSTSSARAAAVLSEHVTGGNLDLVWTIGFNGVGPSLMPLTLAPLDPAYANPSGDHTVALSTTSAQVDGGLFMAVTSPGAYDDYTWEGYVFTGPGLETRRGLFLRSDQATGFTTGYYLAIERTLAQVRFRKLTGQGATTLGSWFLPTTPPFNALLPTNVWVNLKVEAIGNQFRCWLNGIELTSGSPIVDATSPYLTGWVGAYSFDSSAGLLNAYFDDLALSIADGPTPATPATWGAVKARYR
jgi:hypothetical protein